MFSKKILSIGALIAASALAAPVPQVYGTIIHTGGVAVTQPGGFVQTDSGSTDITKTNSANPANLFQGGNSPVSYITAGDGMVNGQPVTSGNNTGGSGSQTGTGGAVAYGAGATATDNDGPPSSGSGLSSSIPPQQEAQASQEQKQAGQEQAETAMESAGAGHGMQYYPPHSIIANGK